MRYLYNILYINKIVEQLFILFVTYKYKKKLPKPYIICKKKDTNIILYSGQVFTWV